MNSENLKKIHFDTFLGKTDYIPLIVKVATQQLTDNTNWDGMKDPGIVISSFLKANSLSMEVNSDWVPVIESNFLESLIPSLFGAEVYESAGGVIDVKAFIKDISDTEKMEVTDIYSGQMEEAIKHLRYLLKNRIDNVEVLMSRFASPLDYAVMMRGGDFYLDLLVEPELSKKFMKKIMDVTIKVIKIFKKELNEDMNTSITLRGLNFPGIRITGDSVVNLSPDMIREYMFPVYDKFADEFGNVMLHYCTLPAPAGHVLPVLTGCRGIKCVDNWQGYKTFFDKKETGIMQEKVSLCTDLSPEEVDNVDKLMTENPFFSSVRRKDGRGIAATVIVQSVDEGKRLYDKWVNYFTKAGICDNTSNDRQ